MALSPPSCLFLLSGNGDPDLCTEELRCLRFILCTYILESEFVLNVVFCFGSFLLSNLSCACSFSHFFLNPVESKGSE